MLVISIVIGLMSCEVMGEIADALYGSPSYNYSSSSSSSSSTSSSTRVRNGKYGSPNGGTGYVEISGSSFTHCYMDGRKISSGQVYYNGDTIKLGAYSAGEIIDSETFDMGSTAWIWVEY